ncbi:MAG: glycoside hydrolase family 6 protein [Thermoleophilia bacterium]
MTLALIVRRVACLAAAALGVGLAPVVASSALAAGPPTLKDTWRERVGAAGRVVVNAVRAPRLGRSASVGAPFAGMPLYADPDGPARAQADRWRATRPDDAALMDRLAAQPQALWLGDWTADVRAAAAERVALARRAGAVPVLVAYNIPDRDCGQHSAGGAADARSYRAWIDALARGLAGGPSIVVLEPDALASLDCMEPDARAARTALIAAAATRLGRVAAARVYIDAGHAAWVPAAEMARRLRAAGVAKVAGFALNVASFQTTEASRAYGTAISRRAGGARFVIDTSRNGAGPAAGGEWCNPVGRAVGASPTTDPGLDRVDALLWVKRPGESDGECNGGPAAGSWWPEAALALVRAAG